MRESRNSSAQYPRPATPQAALRMARTVIGSLIGGPLLLWLVGWITTDGGRSPVGVSGEDFTPGLAMMLWSVLAVGGLAGALFFRGRALGVVEEARRAGGSAAVFERMGEVQTSLLVAMALVEGPALFAGVMFMLFGDVRFLVYAAPVFLLGAALAFPRAEWFGADGTR